MEEFDQILMDYKECVARARAFLRNLQDYALSTRLDNIKKAIPGLRLWLMGGKKATTAPAVRRPQPVQRPASAPSNIGPLSPVSNTRPCQAPLNTSEGQLLKRKRSLLSLPDEIESQSTAVGEDAGVDTTGVEDAGAECAADSDAVSYSG